MKTYLVGGAVRDKLLGLVPKEHDYVVVGSTPEEMLRLGFKKVGRDFPVFLHPVTHDEYALARTERKTDKGYTSFVCYASPEVTLEEDLKRRDLTINAMAEDERGKIIDPFGGRVDLENKVLRHVSESFAEDPVRILRVARFAAKLGDFKVASRTNELMKLMLEQGEVEALVPERVWQELNKSLAENYPVKFFTALEDCKVLGSLFPEIVSGYPNAVLALDRAAKLSKDQITRFSALVFSLGQNELLAFGRRYKIPNSYLKTAQMGLKFKEQSKNLPKEPLAWVNWLEELGSYRNPESFKRVLLAANCNQPELASLANELLSILNLTSGAKLSTLEITSATDKSNLKNTLSQKRCSLLVEHYKKL